MRLRDGVLLGSLAFLSCQPSTTPGGPHTVAARVIPADDCAEARQLRERVEGLLAQGRLERSLRVIQRADKLCPSTEPASWAQRVLIEAELGMDEEAKRTAGQIRAAKAPPAGALEASRKAIDSLSHRPAADADALIAQALASSDPPSARRLFDRAAIQLERKGESRSIDFSAAPIRSMAWSPDATRIAVARGNQLCIYASDPWRLVHCHDALTDLYMLTFWSDGTAVTGHGDFHDGKSSLGVWKVDTGERIAKYDLNLGDLRYIHFDRTGRELAWTNPHVEPSNALHVLDTATGVIRHLLAPARSAGATSGFAVSPDGRHAAATWGPRSLEEPLGVDIWQWPSGKHVASISTRTYMDPTHADNFVFSPDGRYLGWVMPMPGKLGEAVAPGYQGAIGVFDLAARRTIGTYVCDRGWIYDLNFSGDGSRVAASSKGVCVWDVASRRRVASLDIPAGEYGRVSLSPRGQYVLQGYGGSSLLRVRDGAVVAKGLVAPFGWADVPGEAAPYQCESPRCNTPGRSCDCFGQPPLWSARMEDPNRWILFDSNDTPQTIDLPAKASLGGVSPDGKRAILEQDGRRPVIDDKGNILFSLGSKAERASFVNARILAASDEDGFRLWSAMDGKELFASEPGALPVGDVAVTRDKTLVSVRGGMLTWDLPRGSVEPIPTPKGSSISVTEAGIGYSAKSKDHDVEISLFGAAREPFVIPGIRTGHVWPNHDATLFAYLGADFRTHVWSTSTGSRLAGLEPKGLPPILSPIISANARVLAGTMVQPEKLEVFDLTTGANLLDIPVPRGDIPGSSPLAIALSPNGTYLAVATSMQRQASPDTKPTLSPSGKWEGTTEVALLQLWDVKKGQLRWSAEGPWVAKTLRFSPDESVLAAGAPKQAVRLWNTADGSLRKGMEEGVEGANGSISFSPDGAWLVCGGDAVTMIRTIDGKRMVDLRLVGDPASPVPVAVAPDGRIDTLGQPQAVQRAASCRVGKRKVAFQICEDRLVRQGLLKSLLSGDPVADLP